MTTSQPRLTDSALKEAFASRAGFADSRALAGDVLAAVGNIPQRRGWTFRFGKPSSLVPVLIGLALLLAALVGAAIVGARLLRDPMAGSSVIAYTSADIGWSDSPTVQGDALFSVRAAGGDPKRLVDLPGDPRPLVIAPSDTERTVRIPPPVRWSPDGSQIAFRLYTDEPGLYVMHRDGSDLRLVAEATGDVFEDTDQFNSSFAWSPDGSRIAFISPDLTPPGTARNGRLHVVEVDTGSVQQVAVAANGSLAWSPDGSRIAFGRSQVATSALVVINADGTDERSFEYRYLINNHVGPMAWSPDGSKIAFMQERFTGVGEGSYLMVVNSDGTEPRELVGGPEGCCVHGAFGGLLEWSPDGTAIARPAWIDGEMRVRVIAVDGSGTVSTDIPGHWVDWSPDGSQLVVSAPGPAIPGAPSSYRSSSIFVVNSDGTDRRWIAEGDYPAWSPVAQP